MIDIDTNDLRDILDRAAGNPTLTLYLPVDPSDPENFREPGTRPWELQLRNDLDELADALPGEDRAARIRFDEIRSRVQDWLLDYLPAGRTLVLVADEDDVTSVELPVVLDQVAGYGAPLVAEFARALSEYRLYAAVLVDGTSARLVTGSLGFVSDVAALTFDNRWGMDSAGRSGHNFRFENRQDEYQQRHQRTIAEQIDRLVLEFPEFDRLVLGGNEVEAHGVARALGQRATKALVGIISAPMDSSDADLTERLRPLAAQVERDAELAVVAELQAAAGAGRAVFGADQVYRALTQGVAQQVVISSHITDRDQVEQIVAASLAAGAEISFVHEEAANELDPVDGVAARLYYAAVLPNG